MEAAEVATSHKRLIDTSEKGDLLIELDESLERYLNTLDAYQQAQQKLTSHLSSGFLSLAQANFSNATRTRYGQDYYDDRMQALRIVTATDIGSKVTFSVNVVAPVEPRDDPRETTVLDEQCSDPNSDPVPACFETTPNTKNGLSKNVDEDASAKGAVPPPNPIRWFGILVPQTLRSAQSSFVSAVEEPLPQLATLSKDLRQQEIDIGRLRKQIKKL